MRIMRRLPLFPLPIVLFPGAITSLHVFEPRYRRMMKGKHDIEAEGPDHRARAVIDVVRLALDREYRRVGGMCQEVQLGAGRRRRLGVGLGARDDVGRGHRGGRLARKRPAPVSSDVDRDRFVARRVEISDDRGRRGDRNLVLARSTAVDHTDTQAH